MDIPFQVLSATDTVPILSMEPDTVNGHPVKLLQPANELAVPSGSRILQNTSPRSAADQFQFSCATLAEVAFLEAFFAAQKGRAGAFYYPTWQAEFNVHGFAGDHMHVAGNGYAASVFPVGEKVRQFLVVRGARYRTFSVLSATPDVVPGIDLLTWNGGIGSSSDPAVPTLSGPTAAPNRSYRVLWLRYGRFDSDELSVESANTKGGATVTVSVTELPADTINEP